MIADPGTQRRRRPVGRRGFTLVEVLVALAGASLLGGALASLLASQSRFHARNDDAVIAEQTARALFDGLVAELRGASAGDLLLATPDSVTVRFDVLRSVVCDTLAGGGVDLFVYDSIAAPNVPRGFRGTAYSGPYDAPFAYADGFTPISTVSAAAEATCRANGADPGGTRPRSSFRRTSGWSGAFGVTPARGSIARVYGTLTYSVARSTSQPGALAVRRNNQEFAAPLAPGARFEYEMSDGTTRGRVAAGNLAGVRKVRLVAVAMGRNPMGAGRQQVFEAALRN